MFFIYFAIGKVQYNSTLSIYTLLRVVRLISLVCRFVSYVPEHYPNSLLCEFSRVGINGQKGKLSQLGK
jgi:hypothetical protein